ncbi:acyl carrier protein [Patescibacteria group bacterium]|nr:acyl carrier protein [Patescibacteria group bacterium]
MELTDVVIGIVSKTLDVPRAEVTAEKKLVDLAKDSIALFELLVAFEQMTGRRVTYDEIARVETVGDILSYIHSLPAADTTAAARVPQ